jgi:hypothetical protein
LVFDGSLNIFYPVLGRKSRKLAAQLYQDHILSAEGGSCFLSSVREGRNKRANPENPVNPVRKKGNTIKLT